MLRQKIHKLRYKVAEKKETKCIIKQGIIGLKIMKMGKISKNQVESARKVIVKHTKRNCKIWIRLDSSIPLTKKSISSRMGKGIGKFYKSIFLVKKGAIIFEVFFSLILSKHFLKIVLRKSAQKIPLSIKITCKKVLGI